MLAAQFREGDRRADLRGHHPHAFAVRDAGLAAWAGIEPEIAFVLGRDLPRRETPYTEAEVRAAIRETRLVLELMGPRYADPRKCRLRKCWPTARTTTACTRPDGEGAPRPCPSRPVPARHPRARGRDTSRDGEHPDGHPLRPLTWLANWFATNTAGWATGLAAGQIITTGSYAGALDVPLATPLTISFGGLGGSR